MSDVERAKSAATGVESAENTTTTTATTTTTPLSTATTTTTTGIGTTAAAKAAAVKLQLQQQYHQQLYHQPQQQYSNNTRYCNSNSNSNSGNTAATQSQPQHQHQHQHHHHHHHHHHHRPQHYAASTQQAHASETPTDAPSVASFASSCLSQLLKIVFSTPGLVVLVVAYSVMGALLFPLLEAPQDIGKSEAIAKSREECLRELWIITEKLNVLYERNWTMLVHEQLRRFEGSIVAATRNSAVGSRGALTSTTTTLAHFGGSLDAFDAARWSFSEALLYSVTVITTIGHGSLTPRTAAGKIATIFYALIGVPLMLMCLSSLGALLADALQCTYARICCQLTRQQRHHHQHSEHAAEQQHEKSVRIGGGGSGSGGGGGGKYLRRDSVDSLDGCNVNTGGDMLKQSTSIDDGIDICRDKAQALNCKNCKYDTILGATHLSNDYECESGNNVGVGSVTNMERGEDPFQLLHNSPAKLNQNMSATTKVPTSAQYYQQRTDSPQQQQRPDVMLKATAQKVPTQQQQQQQQQQQFYSRSATPSPQHFQQPYQQQQQLSHPLQTFHIVSTASANSSPTHQLPLRQYATLQPHHHHHHSQHYQQLQQQQQQQQLPQPQHFVAVPSTLLRFQPAPATNNCSLAGSVCNGGGVDSGANMPTNMPTANCYQSASVPATASATIYFPIAAAAANTNGSPTSAAAAATGVAAAAAAAASQLLCQQPIVKYHTIQLQHKKKPFITSATGTGAGNAMASVGSDSDMTSDTLPLPPPPAYQTATVHSVRRAKFLTKPLPPEINTLLAESDISCRHDLLQNTASTAATTTATATVTTTAAASNCEPPLPSPPSPLALAASTLPATSIAMLSAGLTATAATTLTPTITANMNSTAATATTNTTATIAPTVGSGSSATVDIMEDEEEQEQQRLGNCSHGTPSRVPLISSSLKCGNNTTQHEESDKSARSLINATAASFHRHTLHTFQRSAQRKSVSYATRRGCNMHATVGRVVCYGDTTETSDDEEYMQRTAGEQFALRQLNVGKSAAATDSAAETADTGDEADTDDDCDGVYSGPQVPISVVLLILVCYICLGTVIFALWENWSIIDGAYFCFVTLATIGYGDFRPERTFHGPQVQLFACCAYLLLGLVLVAMSFSILETQLMWKCKRIAVRLKLAKD